MAFPGNLSNFPFFPLQFNKDAQAVDAAEEQALSTWLQSQGPVELIVISHGWNNDELDALDLYKRMFTSFRSVLDRNLVPAMAGRTIAVAGVFWPSKKFAEEDAIPGGAASAEFLDPLADAFEGAEAAADPAILARLKELTVQGDLTIPERDEAIGLLRQLLAAVPVSNEEGSANVQAAAADGGAFSNEEFLQKLTGEAEAVAAGPNDGGAAGLFSNPLDDLVGAVRTGLNLFTFYTMRERAGLVGLTALNPLLARIAVHANARIHLMGHSFGARLVTAAAAAGGQFHPKSMTLLQAAFSHYGFSTLYDGHSNGAFQSILLNQRIEGPILITHTPNDHAVGWAYPIAARLKSIIASSIDGGPNDPYGGMGRNGAQKTPQATANTLLASGTAGYSFPASGGVLNLESTTFVNGHSGIANEAVAYAVLSAMA
ncbi:hypothetical protein [Paludibaculum fermentans]|uniref:Alpha/beta hydrolase n=1 Tax=Paludibaculum fermentans TaxID=1473598 RepID=A0A7S7NKQ8_PALFE|nr:hypothetical protein [Paludibaculum fermentans]QOY85339.1 hypothetical protein IRI77_21185 [Paludibaculum fermentans]